MALLDLPRAGLGRDPIPGPDPAGESIRYEEDFTRLEDEVGKLQSGGPTAVDWPAVVGMATTILSKRSKDLLVASWLTYALNREEGLAGLLDGIGVVGGIVETYWDDCFPPTKRLRARIGAIEWIADRVGPSLEQLTVTPENAGQLVELFEAVDWLDRTLAEKTDGAQVNIGDLLRPLRNLKRDADFIVAEAARKAEAEAAPAQPVPEAAADPAEPPAAAEPAPAPAAAPAAAPAPPPSPPQPAPPQQPASPPQPLPSVAQVAVPAAAGPEMDRAINALRGNTIALAKAIRAASPGDPRAYSLLRGVLWLPVHAPPPDQGGKTALPDPTVELGPRLAILANGGEPLKLLEFCELNAVDRLFWLDLHRHAAAALEALGHGVARAALVGQTAAFLKRFPSIAGLSFENGTPFADSATRMWIGAELLGGGDAAGGGGADSLGADLDEARSAARAHAVKGDLGEAAAVFEQARNRAVGGRTRFLWDLERARLCMEAGRADLAMALLLHLDKLAHESSLESWDPSVCVDLTVLLLQAGSASEAEASEPELTALRRKWEMRLSRLDMRLAVQMTRPPQAG